MAGAPWGGGPLAAQQPADLLAAALELALQRVAATLATALKAPKLPPDFLHRRGLGTVARL